MKRAKLAYGAIFLGMLVLWTAGLLGSGQRLPLPLLLPLPFPLLFNIVINSNTITIGRDGVHLP